MKFFIKNNIISIVFGTFLSKFIGFIRQIFIAAAYGVGITYDAYNYAAIIPGFLVIIIGGINGPLHNAIVAVLTPLKTNKAALILNQVSLKITSLLIFIGIIIFFKATFIISKIAPSLDLETQIIAAKQLQILSPCIPLSGFIGLSFGALNTKNKFLISSLSPSIISIITIIFISIYWINNFQNLEINFFSKTELLAKATLTGTLIQFLIQLFEINKIGLLNLNISWLRTSREEKRIFKLIIPASLASGLSQINVFIDMFFISSFSGAASGLAYGNLLIQAPLGILSNAIILPLLPKFSKLIDKNQIKELQKIFIKGIEYCLLSSVFLGGLFISFNDLIVGLIYQRGAFDFEAFSTVKKILIAYAVGIPFYLYKDLLIRFFYSLEKTKLPFQLSLMGIILNICFDWILTGGPTTQYGNLFNFNFGVVGVVLSSGLVNLIICFILSIKLNLNNYKIPNFVLLKKVIFIIFACLISSLISRFIINSLYDGNDNNLVKIIILTLGLFSFSSIYYILTKILKVNRLNLRSIFK